jgi:hypothetical protein
MQILPNTSSISPTKGLVAKLIVWVGTRQGRTKVKSEEYANTGSSAVKFNFILASGASKQFTADFTVYCISTDSPVEFSVDGTSLGTVKTIHYSDSPSQVIQLTNTGSDDAQITLTYLTGA